MRNPVGLCTIVAAVILFGSGCPSTPVRPNEPPRTVSERLKQAVTPAKPQPVCLLLLFDLSVGEWKVRERYAAEFAKLLKQMRGGDRIVCDVLTEGTEQSVSFTVDETMPVSDGSKSEMQNKSDTFKFGKTISANVNTLLSKKASNSDIISAFVVAPKVLEGSRAQEFSRRVLVLFTDAVEQTPKYDFMEERDLTDARIQKIVEAEKKAGRTPSLPGVEVYMAGVGASPTTNKDLTQDRLAWISKFWQSYAAATQATLDPSNYGPSLTNLKLH